MKSLFSVATCSNGTPLIYLDKNDYINCPKVNLINYTIFIRTPYHLNLNIKQPFDRVTNQSRNDYHSNGYAQMLHKLFIILLLTKLQN